MLQINYGNVNSKIHFSVLRLGACNYLRFLQAGWAEDALLQGRGFVSALDSAYVGQYPLCFPCHVLSLYVVSSGESSPVSSLGNMVLKNPFLAMDSQNYRMV